MRQIAILLTLSLLLLQQTGCKRRDDPTAPAVTAADRALPVPVDMPPDAPTSSATSASATQAAAAGKQTAHRVPVEDTLEPVPIDDATLPTDAKGFEGKTRK